MTHNQNMFAAFMYDIGVFEWSAAFALQMYMRNYKTAGMCFCFGLVGVLGVFYHLGR
jgi:hypothetical protein